MHTPIKSTKQANSGSTLRSWSHRTGPVEHFVDNHMRLGLARNQGRLARGKLSRLSNQRSLTLARLDSF
jgi:hypothetical protein